MEDDAVKSDGGGCSKREEEIEDAVMDDCGNAGGGGGGLECNGEIEVAVEGGGGGGGMEGDGGESSKRKDEMEVVMEECGGGGEGIGVDSGGSSKEKAEIEVAAEECGGGGVDSGSSLKDKVEIEVAVEECGGGGIVSGGSPKRNADIEVEKVDCGGGGSPKRKEDIEVEKVDCGGGGSPKRKEDIEVEKVDCEDGGNDGGGSPKRKAENDVVKEDCGGGGLESESGGSPKRKAEEVAVIGCEGEGMETESGGSPKEKDEIEGVEVDCGGGGEGGRMEINDGGSPKRKADIEVAVEDCVGGVSPKRKAGTEVVVEDCRVEGEGVEVDGGEMVKRRKKEVENGKVEDEVMMKRVAEIVLVLSAMGRMRAGRDPTAAEKAMMAEARAKAVALCEELAPKDVVPVDAFGAVIDDLGLNRLKETLGVRHSKVSILDRIANSKRRMEESKVFAAQPASFTSQKVQTANGAAVDNRGTSPAVNVPPSDKVGHVPVSTGTFQPPTPVANVSSAVSTPVQFHPPGFDALPAGHSPVLLNNIGRNSTSTPPPRHDRAHLRPEGKPNGQSLPHVPVSSAASQHMSRTAPVHVRPQLPMQASVGTKSMLPDQPSARTDIKVSLNAPQMASQPAVAQMPGLAVGQTAPGNLQNMHHPVQGMPFVHAPVVNHHLEVSRLVQKLLTPKLPQRSVWTPPSRDYMNRALQCQFCKLVINEVENMVVCDACEKGFHLGCLQSHNAKSIRGEWHCPRCLSISNGKPFPPKYGRVTRNMNVPKALPNTTGAQLQSDRKVGTMSEKMNQPNATIDRIQDFKTRSQVNQPNATTNGSQDLKTPPQAVKVIGSSTEPMLRYGYDNGGKNLSIGEKKDGPKSEKCPSVTTGTAVEASSLTSVKSSCDKPSQQVKSEILSEDQLMSETQTMTQDLTNNDVEQKVDSVEIPVNQHSDSNGAIESHLCKDDQKGVQKNLVEIKRDLDQAEELAGASDSSLHDVEWIGDADGVVDNKKFFRSCRINGTKYQLQKYALLRSRDGKLIPMKLQAMWEDSQTSSKWLLVHKCYFPDDLPEEVGRPGAPQSNEVYESTHDNYVLAGFVQGPCEVLPFRKFGEESEKSEQGSLAKDGKQPIFIRNWFYDDTRRAFCPSAS